MVTCKTKIMIDTIDKIKEFNSKANSFPDIDLVSGRYRISAASLMGIFSLDVSQPITMEYPAMLHEFIVKAFDKWIID